MPLLSVVVPFRNVERYVGACLESLRRQTLTDLEVVLVDDGSTDGTRALVDALAAQDARFRVIEQPNAGPGPARNAGIAAASGEFLAFMDADDVVHLNTYRHLTGLLADSGSDLAVGNAGRFNNLGATSSYVHQVAITENARATHLRERPELVLDRMAWNKVFRRDFWDATGLSFPALMMGEDFPVCIAAHVAARSVDVSMHLAYYWRERDGGEPSITQRSAEFAHLDDRLTSAYAVLDTVEAAAPASWPLLRHHFMDIDVTAVVAALQAHPVEDHPAIMDRATALAARLGPDALDDLEPFHRVQAALLEARDSDALLDLHRARHRRGTKPAVVRKGRLRKRYFEAWPGLGEGRAPEETYQLPGPDLEVCVQNAVWNDSRVDLTGLVVARMPIGPRSTLEAWLQREKDGARIDVPLSRSIRRRGFHGDDLVGFSATLDPATLPHETGYWTLRFRLGGPEVRGELGAQAPSFESARYSASRWLDEGAALLVQPMRGAPGFGLMVRRAVALLTDSRADGDRLELRLRLQPEAGPAQLRLTARNGGSLVVPLVAGPDDEHTALVPVAELADLPDFLSPIVTETLWDATVERGGKSVPVLRAPGAAAAVVRIGHREVAATRNFSGGLQLVESRLAPRVHRIARDGDLFRFEGTWAGDQELPEDVVLEHFEHPGEGLVLRVPLTRDGKRYSFTVDAAALVRAQRDQPDPYEGVAPPPWHLVLPFADHLAPQVADRNLLGELPAPRDLEGRRVAVTAERFDLIRIRIS